MVDSDTAGFIAECFWPAVTEADLPRLDRRARCAAADLRRRGAPVRYLGSILMRADEVVLCLYEGREDAVLRAARRARVPFERIVAGTHSFPPFADHLGGDDDAST